MTTMRDALLGLIADLRAAGVRISVAESLDAMCAVAAAGLERARMREALAAALIKDEADRAVFDRTFAQRFAHTPARADPRQPKRANRSGVSGASGGPGNSGTALSGRLSKRDETPAAESGPPRDTAERPPDAQIRHPAWTRAAQNLHGEGEAQRPEAKTSGAEFRQSPQTMSSEGDAQAGIEAATSGAGARAAAHRALELVSFASYSDAEYDAARDALALIRRRFRVRLSRRLKIAAAGRIDFRRTLRAAIQRGGHLGDLRYRARRPRHLDLLILADISGSVRYASSLMLELTAGAREFFRHVRSFVFIDRLAAAEFERGHLVMSPPLDLYARSDFGRVFAELWERRATLVGRATVIVIMGDGRNNRRPARADLLRDLARISRAIIWLNPEAPERWNTGDSAIGQYARVVGHIVPAANLRQLEHGLAHVV